MPITPLIVPLASVPGASPDAPDLAFAGLVSAHFGLTLAPPGYGATHLDVDTRATVSVVVLPTPTAPLTGRDLAISLSADDLAARRVAGFYVVGYYAPRTLALVLVGYATLGDILHANRDAAHVYKRRPTPAADRIRAEWMPTYTLPLIGLRPLAELVTLLTTLRTATAAWDVSRGPVERANGVDLQQVLGRPISDELHAQALAVAAAREAKKRHSVETLHATHDGNYGSHEAGVIAEGLVAEEYGLVVDTRVLSTGDGGIDFTLASGITVDAKGNANMWRTRPTDVRLKEESVQWGDVSQVYVHVWYSKALRQGELVGWCFLDEVLRHGPARKFTSDPKSPFNCLLPVAQLRPMATFGAMVDACRLPLPLAVAA